MATVERKENVASSPAMNPVIVDNIKHVVVLMMENRSFDHIFGAFPGVDGVQNANYNLVCPQLENATRNPPYSPWPINVQMQSSRFWADHLFGGMMTEIFGPACEGYLSAPGAITGYDASNPIPLNETYYPSQTMCGYVSTNGVTCSESTVEGEAMSYFEYLPSGNPGRLNVLHTLAENFVVCDNWFCDTPSETVPNRFFVHAATNMGYNDDNANPGPSCETDLWNAPTIYSKLDDINNTSGPNWFVYGWPGGAYDSDMFSYCHNAPTDQYNRDIAEFANDIENGNLPFYSFLMPSLNISSNPQSNNGNSMHPSGDVRLGENYIAQVYMALRNSNIWNNTLLIITFDENGGIYDHKVPPPATPPDSITYPVGSSNALFDYSILGPRIPALLISPWLANLDSSTPPLYQIDQTQYQNTSIPRFVQDLFEAQNNGNTSIGGSFLTQRDKNAPSVANSTYWRSTPSTGCPTNIEIYTGNDVHGNPIPPWGTCLTGEEDCPSTSMLDETPTETALHFARTYLSFYPGHPDSGKPFTKEFKSNSELIAYMQERKEAARNHARRGGQPNVR